MVTEIIKSHTSLTDWAGVVGVTATNCCICHRRLTDAESVQNGIGPVCGRRYYSKVTPTEENQLAMALGELVASDLPEKVIDAVIARKANPRQACNVLVYWASAHYDQRDTVLSCSRIVREFGYEILADKLEEDRTRLSIRIFPDVNGGEDWIVAKGYQSAFRGNVGTTLCGGLVREGKKTTEVGFLLSRAEEFTTWLHFNYEREAVFCGPGVFGRAQGGVLELGEAGPECQARMRALIQPAPKPSVKGAPAGEPVYQKLQGICIKPDPKTRTFDLIAPYCAGFVTRMKSSTRWQDRKWMGRNWRFSYRIYGQIKQLIHDTYGVTL